MDGTLQLTQAPGAQTVLQATNPSWLKGSLLSRLVRGAGIAPTRVLGASWASCATVGYRRAASFLI